LISMEQKSPRICMVVFFLHEAFSRPLSNIRQVILEISPESCSIIVASPELSCGLLLENEKIKTIVHTTSANPVLRVINYGILNLKISWNIIKKTKNTDIFLFFMETGLPLPMVIAKVLNKKIFWLFPSSLEKRIEHHEDYHNQLLIPFQSLSYQLADKIVLYSPNLVKEWKLEAYADKIFFAHEHFINLDILSVSIPFNWRAPVIGYIGRLSEEKGVLNFVRSLPAVLAKDKDLTVLIGGDGPLKEEIEKFLADNNLINRVRLTGWIPSDSLPQFLNELRLLVLPSFTEGLPNIMLEAMACGTPVLATPVGAVPDFIEDGKTGFIMENNSSACITENINLALMNPGLEEIIMNAKKMVEKEFSFEETINTWRKIFRLNAK
jgi:glycosyltransferase involved in cell wall biosynthesis